MGPPDPRRLGPLPFVPEPPDATSKYEQPRSIPGLPQIKDLRQVIDLSVWLRSGRLGGVQDYALAGPFFKSNVEFMAERLYDKMQGDVDLSRYGRQPSTRCGFARASSPCRVGSPLAIRTRLHLLRPHRLHRHRLHCLLGVGDRTQHI